MSHQVPALAGDRGSVDESIAAMFGFAFVVAFVLLVIEAGAYWHARNLYDAAAAEAARLAAASDGSCADGEQEASSMLSRRGSWARAANVDCVERSGVVTVEISGSTPGILFRSGHAAAVAASAPKERP